MSRQVSVPGSSSVIGSGPPPADAERAVPRSRRVVAAAAFALAVAHDGEVDGHHDRSVACGGRALDGVPRPLGIRLRVELEPARRLGRRRRHLLERARRRRRDDHRHAGRRRGARRRDLRVGVQSPCAAIGAIASGSAHGAPSIVVAVVTPRHVHEDTRPQAPPPPGGHILRQGDLVPRPAGDVVEDLDPERLPGQRLELRQAEDPRQRDRVDCAHRPIMHQNSPPWPLPLVTCGGYARAPMADRRGAARERATDRATAVRPPDPQPAPPPAREMAGRGRRARAPASRRQRRRRPDAGAYAGTAR